MQVNTYTMATLNFPTYMDEHSGDKKSTAAAPPPPPQQVQDPLQLHPLLNMPIPKGVEYTTIEDPTASSGWGDSLMYLNPVPRIILTIIILL